MALGRAKERLDDFQQGHAWLGFPFAVVKKFGEDRGGQQAALVAYYGFFSLFPLLLAFVTILGIVLKNNPQLRDDVLRSALSQFPIIGEQIGENIGSISTSGLALAVGLLGALWAGLAGVKAMQNALDTVWDVPVREQPKKVKLVLRGLAMLVVLAALTFVATGLAGTGAEGEALPTWARVFTFPLSLLVNVVVFLLAYKILTEADVSWRDVLPGALLAAVAWTALQAVGNYYVANQLRNATAMYGFFGIVIGLLSWMFLAAQVTLLCAEVNVVRARRLWPRSLGGGPETEADRRALELHAKVEERVPEERVEVGFSDSPPR